MTLEHTKRERTRKTFSETLASNTEYTNQTTTTNVVVYSIRISVNHFSIRASLYILAEVWAEIKQDAAYGETHSGGITTHGAGLCSSTGHTASQVSKWISDVQHVPFRFWTIQNIALKTDKTLKIADNVMQSRPPSVACVTAALSLLPGLSGRQVHSFCMHVVLKLLWRNFCSQVFLR